MLKKTLTYSYDLGGNLVTVKEYAFTTAETLPASPVRTETGTQTYWYRYDSGANLISVTIKGKIYFYVRNAQNDIIGLIDAAGNMVVKYEYDSWGKLISITGSLADTIGVQNPFRYRGYYYDNETGMYYLKSRYYDPEIRRFVSADDTDVLSIEQGSLLQYNLYTYCLNNPVNRMDEDGHLSLPNWAKVAIGAVAIAIGVAVVAVSGGTAAAIPALLTTVKMVTASAAINAGISAIGHRVSTGSWKGVESAVVNGAASGVMWGGITMGASTAALASKGVYVNKIGKLKPANKPGNGYFGLKYATKRNSGKLAYKSLELHSPHKGGTHQSWHWQRNSWSYNSVNKTWTISSKAKRWNIFAKRI